MGLEQELERERGFAPTSAGPVGGGGLNPLMMMRFIGGAVGLVIIVAGLFLVFPLFREIYGAIKDPSEMVGQEDKWMGVVMSNRGTPASDEAQAVRALAEEGTLLRAMCALMILLMYVVLARIGIAVFVGGGKLVALCTDETQGIKKLVAQLLRAGGHNVAAKQDSRSS
ncbi:MAG: hypothetical protein V2A74_02185 [bacterium]